MKPPHPDPLPGEREIHASELAVVYVTASDGDEGARIARALVDERLAACVNIVPGVRSIYSWKGKTCDEPEVLLVAKTRMALVDRIVGRVKELHSYELPETVALPLAGGSPAYLEWVKENTT